MLTDVPIEQRGAVDPHKGPDVRPKRSHWHHTERQALLLSGKAYIEHPRGVLQVLDGYCKLDNVAIMACGAHNLKHRSFRRRPIEIVVREHRGATLCSCLGHQ